MKKLTLVLLALVMCISMCACGSETASSAPESSAAQPQTVVLTPENLSEHLDLNVSYGEFERVHLLGDFYSGKIELLLESFALKGGYFNDTEITLDITLPIGWSYDGEEKMTITIKVPADGKLENTYELSSISDSKPYTDCKCEVVSVSGTFVPN